MKTVSLKLPETLEAQLSEAARARRVTRSALVREAIAAFLAARGAPRRSFLALAGDLVGCVEAEPGLSVDAKHLRGYGR